MSREPTDRRVRRSRRLLRDALISLILERGWDQVSVQDVCARADVGRSTFYAHFADKEDLLLSGFDELHGWLDEIRGTREGAFEFADELLAHARDNLRLFRAVVGRKGGQEVRRRFRDVVYQLVSDDLAGLGIDRDQRPAIAEYVTGGFIDLMMSWLDRPSKRDPAALAETFRTLTRGALSAASQR